MKKEYILMELLSINKLIDELLTNNKDSKFFNIDTNIEVNINKIYLDNENQLSNFKGNILLKNQKIVGKLNGNFSKIKN